MDFEKYLVWSIFLTSSISNLNSRVSANINLNLVKILIIWILTAIARSLFNIPDNIATPCSVKAYRKLRVLPQLDLPNWNSRFSNSSAISWNTKSSGNRLMFRLWALFKFPAVTPYHSARSFSSITFWPLIKNILLQMISSGILMLLLFWVIRFTIRCFWMISTWSYFWS